MKLAPLAVAVALSFIPVAGFAQAAPTAPENNATINQRKGNQQDRIAQGDRSGQLTAGETSRIEHQEAGINHEEHGMRAQDNGHLTHQDRRTLQRQQNAESRRIYRDKHNGRVR